MEILFSKNAKKSILSLDKKFYERVLNAIENIPAGDIKPLKNYSSAYRLRVGDYRVLYTLKEDILKIDDILPRGSAYKK
ncbi:MAG: type II toxin-antitoxin system RelE/ParE family toxin [Clostridiales bacterium]|jgi:mRNA interferase RelE/StbE|nr:type II toxin-antitoxin system RelE/ParE family toxin [Clostridiales bacterium]